MALDNNFATNITNAVKSLVEADGLLDLSNVIYSATSEIGDFATKHNVITDVRNGILVPIITLGNNYGALSADVGDCSMNTCGLNASYSTKKWLLGDYNCRVPICLKTYSEDFKLFWGMYNQTLESPLDEADKYAYIAFLTNIAQKNIQGALWRTGYWGDVSATTNALISKNNGIWTEADAGVGEKLEMTAGELTGEQVYNYLAQMYTTASNEDWFNESTAQFIISRKMAKTLVTWLNSLSDKSMYNCDCIDPSKVVSSRVFGIDNLSIFGIPVVSHKESDEAGKVVSVTPDYRALLINKDNVLVGVNTTEHLDQFDIFYDKKDRKIYVDLAIQIGTAIPLDEYVYATQA